MGCSFHAGRVRAERNMERVCWDHYDLLMWGVSLRQENGGGQVTKAVEPMIAGAEASTVRKLDGLTILIK